MCIEGYFSHITSVIRHSSLVISFLFPSLHSPFERKFAKAKYVIRGRFVIFSSLSPFGGSGAYRINDLPHSPFGGSQRQLGMCTAKAEYV